MARDRIQDEVRREREAHASEIAKLGRKLTETEKARDRYLAYYHDEVRRSNNLRAALREAKTIVEGRHTVGVERVDYWLKSLTQIDLIHNLLPGEMVEVTGKMNPAFEEGPKLGLATTKELIVELEARADVAATVGESWPNYRTVGGS